MYVHMDLGSLKDIKILFNSSCKDEKTIKQNTKHKTVQKKDQNNELASLIDVGDGDGDGQGFVVHMSVPCFRGCGSPMSARIGPRRAISSRCWPSSMASQCLPRRSSQLQT